ncbi:MAG: type II toxin-antitoxin system RelE/ParE family toxin [Nitrospirae bacterium]|nr:type II toxin-antitoxin system RelE/ParE family toxin [Nitrospirota bacterium]MCL5285685.1 type II toxin-antitoxin system RelE/ParE family toxin [Nitrospirota bacterium]
MLTVAGCKKTLGDFPEEVQNIILSALLMAQKGDKHPDAKPLKGFHGASVLEVVVPFDTNAYRAVYTTKVKEAIYVLDIFQKKSKSGIATPKKEIDLIKKRLAQVERHHKGKSR